MVSQMGAECQAEAGCEGVIFLPLRSFASLRLGVNCPLVNKLVHAKALRRKDTQSRTQLAARSTVQVETFKVHLAVEWLDAGAGVDARVRTISL